MSFVLNKENSKIINNPTTKLEIFLYCLSRGCISYTTLGCTNGKSIEIFLNNRYHRNSQNKIIQTIEHEALHIALKKTKIRKINSDKSVYFIQTAFGRNGLNFIK